MAAPTPGNEPTIHDRLVSLLDDSPKPPEKPEDSQDTKPVEGEEEGEPEVTLKDDGTPTGEEEAPKVEEPGEEAPKVEEPGEEEGTINTLADLAEVFEVEEKELLEHLEVDAGGGNTVTLGKVISAYKDAPEAIQKYEELKGREVAYQAEATALRERTDAAVRDLAVHAQTLLDITNEEFKDVDWKALETEDPQTYLIMKVKQAERGALIQGAIDKLRSTENQRLADLQDASGKTRQAEVASLHRKMPEWSEPEVANAAMGETHSFLLESEFSAEEINGITDHRYLLVAWKAAQFDKLKKKAPKKLKQLRGLPKPKGSLRSGARRDASGDAREKAQAKFDRLKKTGDERDAARLFEELI